MSWMLSRRKMLGSLIGVGLGIIGFKTRSSTARIIEQTLPVVVEPTYPPFPWADFRDPEGVLHVRMYIVDREQLPIWSQRIPRDWTILGVEQPVNVHAYAVVVSHPSFRAVPFPERFPTYDSSMQMTGGQLYFVGTVPEYPKPVSFEYHIA